MEAKSRVGIGSILCIALALLFGSAATRAEDNAAYDFAAAAKEITQLYWLAEMATVCGWASEEDSLKFKHFSVRFLSAHLPIVSKAALVSMVTENGYADKVRRVANEGAETNCGNPRWQNGWLAYKSAADEHERDF